jgi:hypothetical protein
MHTSTSMKKNRISAFIILIQGISLVSLGIVYKVAIFKVEHGNVKIQIPTNFYHELILWLTLEGIFSFFLGND